MGRRNIFRLLLGLLPTFGLAATRKPKLASGAEILRSFDARDWARNFVEHARQIPGLATDEGTMTSWFANALMRGYDEAWSDHNKSVVFAGESFSRDLQYEAVQGAVARVWCADENHTKEMDVELGQAITREIMMLRYPGAKT